MPPQEAMPSLPFSLPRNALLHREQLCREPRMTRVLAAFLDVSGYTAFAEQIIAQHKDRGLGQLVDELERILVPAANAALRHQGNIVAVEGDALMVTFEEADHLVRFCREVEPHRCALARTPDGVIHLISSALHYELNLAWVEARMPGL